MKTRFEVTSSPNAGPRRSSTRSGTCSTSKIDTRGPGAAAVVFNTLGWPRSDLAEVNVGFGEGGVGGVVLADPDGQTVPTQILESTRYADGGLKTARVAFIARDVPRHGIFDVITLSPARGGESEGRVAIASSSAARSRSSSSRMNIIASLSTARPGR